MNVTLEQLLVMIVKAAGGEIQLTIADLEDFSTTDSVHMTWTESGLILEYKNVMVIDG